MNIQQATHEQAEEIAVLFDLYRQFYGKDPDLEGATDFIKARMLGDDSVIFTATHNGEIVGFVQLYPTFSSVSMQRTWILNDLFVVESARKLGAGQALLDEAARLAEVTGARALSLETAATNETAQRLYERNGFVQDNSVFFYSKITG